MAEGNFLSACRTEYAEWFSWISAVCGRRRVDPSEVASELYYYFARRHEREPGWPRDKNHLTRLTRIMARQQASRLLRPPKEKVAGDELSAVDEQSARRHRSEPARGMIEPGMCEELRSTLHGQPQETIQAAYLSCQGKTQIEIAHALGCSLSTARRRLDDARAWIKGVIRKNESEAME